MPFVCIRRGSGERFGEGRLFRNEYAAGQRASQSAALGDVNYAELKAFRRVRV
jgi:hypothetical protein